MIRTQSNPVPTTRLNRSKKAWPKGLLGAIHLQADKQAEADNTGHFIDLVFQADKMSWQYLPEKLDW